MLKVVCIPAYNEEKLIRNTVQKCLKYAEKIIVCDDGSVDSTSEEAKKGGATIIRHEKNMGKGAALKTLFKSARDANADVMVTIDGDGQFLPEEIEKMMKPILEDKADVVIGYRFDNSTEMPAYRKIGNKFLDKITNIASELSFRDTQSGFRAYSKKAIKVIHFVNDGFSADSEILIDASRKNLRISEEKVTVIYDTGEKTSTLNPVSHSAGVIASLVEIVAIRHPLKYLGIPGLILIGIGISFGIVVISYFNETRQFSIPSTLVSLGGLTLGTVFLLMSIVLFSIARATMRWKLDK